jgi:hypothetical protein
MRCGIQFSDLTVNQRLAANPALRPFGQPGHRHPVCLSAGRAGQSYSFGNGHGAPHILFCEHMWRAGPCHKTPARRSEEIFLLA